MSQQTQKLLSFAKSKVVNFHYGPLNRSIIKEELLTSGYCVFRNTGIKSTKDLYSQHLEIFNTIPNETFNSSKLLDYKEGTDARDVHLNENEKKELIPILGITESTKRDNFLGYHCELAYTDIIPKILSFTCLNPGTIIDKTLGTGGMTPISDTYNFWKDLKDLNPNFADKLLKYGLKYFRRYPSAEIEANSPFKTWQEMFGYNKSKLEIENIVTNLGFNYIWLENDSLRLDYVKSAVIKHSSNDNDYSFGNSILGFHGTYFNDHKIFGQLVETNPKLLPLHCTLGDEQGTEFTKEEINLVYHLFHKNAICYNWQKEDVVIMDNIWWSHARSPVYTQDRDIVAMMGFPLIRQSNGIDVQYQK